MPVKISVNAGHSFSGSTGDHVLPFSDMGGLTPKLLLGQIASTARPYEITMWAVDDAQQGIGTRDLDVGSGNLNTGTEMTPTNGVI